jgi:hypothetical protein
MDLRHSDLVGVDWESASALVDGLNALIRDAGERGFGFQIHLDGGEVVDLTDDRVSRVVWRSADGRDYHLTALEVVTITEASQLTGIKRSTLYQRVFHAEQRGDTTPFFRAGDRAGTGVTYLAVRQLALDWIKNWRRRTSSSSCK